MAPQQIKVAIIDEIDQFAQDVSTFVTVAMPTRAVTTIIETDKHQLSKRLRERDESLKSADIIFVASAIQDWFQAREGYDIIKLFRDFTPNSVLIVYSGRGEPPTHGADLFISRHDIQHRQESRNWIQALVSFIDQRKEKKDRLDQRLILPVQQSISFVNERLVSRFRKNPELLREIRPREFEKFVVELFEDEGYTVVLTPSSRDGGKDLYVTKVDKAANIRFVVECKRYRPPNKVGVHIVRQLYGVVQRERVSGGIIVTTSYFTRDATDFSSDLPYQLFLRDFDDLSRWLNEGMIENNLPSI